MKQLKIAFSGKGGVGKTTMSAIFANLLQEKGHRVLAVDADPDANLGMALGFDPTELSRTKTIADDRELIKKKTGAEPGVQGSWFALNPKVDDIPEQYTITRNNIHLLQMGNANKGGSGCACPESSLLKTLLNHLVTEDEDALVIDFEAGLEHLGRSTAQSVDALVIVVEPGKRSIETANAVKQLALDIGINDCFVIKNKWIETNGSTFTDNFPEEDVIGTIPYHPVFIEADEAHASIYEQLDDDLKQTCESMLSSLSSKINRQLI
ncbi:ATP-binding protein [Salisediminibacterium beveridgei]|uniref:CO dehydrogenase accessory protein CooC (Nickel insertion) n=1 Tax=Salisediminibacterium beveridgei TaxID=632773 RepID=A0A1D7QXC7_9BACI|nr:AAA family ATPase [Salisediminibacterium beveridgei]AOM83666.1 CO dehydrogenase accessory protein CooC (nickel insertion) [Salisediminibacterium beveridgei]